MYLNIENIVISIVSWNTVQYSLYYLYFIMAWQWLKKINSYMNNVYIVQFRRTNKYMDNYRVLCFKKQTIIPT